MTLPAIAAAMDFMNSKMIGEILRQCGAFFIRRAVGDVSRFFMYLVFRLRINVFRNAFFIQRVVWNECSTVEWTGPFSHELVPTNTFSAHCTPFFFERFKLCLQQNYNVIIAGYSLLGNLHRVCADTHCWGIQKILLFIFSWVYL